MQTHAGDHVNRSQAMNWVRLKQTTSVTSCTLPRRIAFQDESNRRPVICRPRLTFCGSLAPLDPKLGPFETTRHASVLSLSFALMVLSLLISITLLYKSKGRATSYRVVRELGTSSTRVSGDFEIIFLSTPRTNDRDNGFRSHSSIPRLCLSTMTPMANPTSPCHYGTE